MRITAALLLLGCGSTCVGAASSEQGAPAAYHDDWEAIPDRPWAGPDWYANRVQDWRVKDGRLECVTGAARRAGRTAHLLTRSLDGSRAFEIAVTIQAADAGPPDPKSASGILLGIGEPGRDHRAAAMVQQAPGPAGGLLVWLDGEGRLNIGSFGGQRAEGHTWSIGGGVDPTALPPRARSIGAVLPDDGPVRLTVSWDGQFLSAVAEQPHGGGGGSCSTRYLAADVTGGVSLFSARGAQGGTHGFAFSDFSLTGGVAHPGRAWGPVLGLLYTLDQSGVGVADMRLTAQLPVLAAGDVVASRLLIDGRAPIPGTTGPEGAWTLTWTVPGLAVAADRAYRVEVDLRTRLAGVATGSAEGVVRAAPSGDRPFVLGSLSCMKNRGGPVRWDHHGLWFPHEDLVERLAAQDPDMLFFAGDQIYEGDITPPDLAPLDIAISDYHSKWQRFLWAFGELTARMPTVTIPDDHDVFHGNLWGSGGIRARKSKGVRAQDAGGYKMPAEFVNVVHATQTSHLPPTRVTPVIGQGITTYTTSLAWGGVDFAVIDDRMWKDAPRNAAPEGDWVNGWPQASGFSLKELHAPDASLWGEEQESFIEKWGGGSERREDTWTRVVLAQSPLGGLHTLPKGSRSDAVISGLTIHGPGEYPSDDLPVADADTNGWPTTGRDRAVRLLAAAGALHLGGDQHLGTVAWYGADAFRDGTVGFTSPAIGNSWPRRWMPSERGLKPAPGAPRYTGDFRDGFNNRVTVLAAANPRAGTGVPAALHDRSAGYGIVRFDHTEKSVILEAWPRGADPSDPSAQFPGWPVRLTDRARPVDEVETVSLLRPGETVVLVGNVLAERQQHDGWLEAELQTAVPGHKLSFRNLGFSADEVGKAPRVSGFGSRAEWLKRVEADVVLAFFGFNESFRGPEGIDVFQRDLDAYLDMVGRTGTAEDPAPRVILFGIPPVEDLRDPALPDPVESNERLARYDAAIARVAAKRGLAFVDLRSPMGEAYATAASNRSEPLTMNGVHLTPDGNRALAAVIGAALTPDAEPADPDRLMATREQVVAKNLLWWNRYRTTDGYNVYGGRSSLEYMGGISNFDVLQRELHILDAQCARADRYIWTAASGTAHDPSEVALPEPIEVRTNRPGPLPDGTYDFLGGEEAIQKMTPADGTRVTLFADESVFPEMVNPVQMAFDGRGRLWVAVWPTYPHWTPGTPMNDKLLILEDTDSDGRADKRTVFAGDLHNPTGFEFWDGGVYVAQAPDLVVLADTDGDDVADERRRVLHGLSSADTHHTANSFVFGPDGALYFQEGVFHRTSIETVRGPLRNKDAAVWRFEPRTWRVERFMPYGFANPHGHVVDDWGRHFVTDGTSNTNYYALPATGHVEQPGRQPGFFPFFKQRSRPAAATEILSSTAFPPEFRGDYLIANVIGFQGIHRYEITGDGSGFTATEKQPLVTSTDPRFRPVDIEVGPDGAVYFLDWHNPLIGHMQHHLRDPNRDGSHGRVYRIIAEGAAHKPGPSLEEQSTPDLVHLLASPEARVRSRVRAVLSARDTRAVVSAARAWAMQLNPSDPADAQHLLEVLWLQQQHDVLDRELLLWMLDSPDARARAAAVGVVRRMRHHLPEALFLLSRAATDGDPGVRLAAVVGLSFFDGAEAAESALAVVNSPMDRFLDHALTQTLKTIGPAVRERLLSGEPFCADNPTGLARVLEGLSTNDVLALPLNPEVCRVLLRRPGVEAKRLLVALEVLGEGRDIGTLRAWREAVLEADQGSHSHADHILSGLFEAVSGLPRAVQRRMGSVFVDLATTARRPSTRSHALAARVRREDSWDKVWNEAVASGSLVALLEAAPLVRGRDLRQAAFARVADLVEKGVPDDGPSGVRGRTVRIELPGDPRTLTLAEVQVFSRGQNIARGGMASQASTASGGHPGRAIDGNTSGAYGSGSQTHTREDLADPWWQVDLGSEQTIDEVRVWTRTEAGGVYAARLEGFLLRILDDAGRETCLVGPVAAPKDVVTLVVDRRLSIRRAAVGALAALGDVRPDRTAGLLVGVLEEPLLGEVALHALVGLDPTLWKRSVRVRVSGLLTRWMTSRDASFFLEPQGKDVLALADRLVPHLGSMGRSLARARRGLGPLTVVIRPVPDRLEYDRKDFAVRAGRTVELVFENSDLMPHNWLLAAIGSLAKVGLAAEAMGADGGQAAWVPDLPEVIVATGLLQPGESQTLTFTAPSEPGDYPYVCTFPGHWIRMNGVMSVVAEGASDLPPVAAAAPSSATRRFVRDWTVGDLAGDLSGVSSRDPGPGLAVLEAASCLSCHRTSATDTGPATGPPLATSVARYDRSGLLRQILEPSAVIADGYATEVFFRTDERIVQGRVVGELNGELRIQDDPYDPTSTILLPTADIDERQPAAHSAMPSALLNTFTRPEILDLLAYLSSLPES